ncbi:hypothetical protein QP222_12310 [Corynebacterium pyruviciproducens]|uniref:hypothetical protein n=1 Tax=Corynebacterium pyruviciproducens TaxID=598660 RepID=UPI00254D2AFA|nr:hypothetical protein [Corynebacterium pyruviciproducens]MDK6567185.1 hypothetical protein [Corynebacterium pyruviciproducens]
MGQSCLAPVVGGALLLCVGGRGWYQEWGSPAVLMEPGDAVSIPAGVKHRHGAPADSWFSHLAIDIPGTEASNEWLEPVSSAEYEAAGKLGWLSGCGWQVCYLLKIAIFKR